MRSVKVININIREIVTTLNETVIDTLLNVHMHIQYRIILVMHSLRTTTDEIWVKRIVRLIMTPCHEII